MRSFKGRSRALSGAASMTGVPAAGLPKMTRTVSRKVRPAARAAAAWSMTAKTVTPLAPRMSRNLAVTSATVPVATFVITRS
nr:hypothetical protein [Kribbella capetownensis]